MKLTSCIVLALLTSGLVITEQKLADGGRSPDGQLEVRISRERMNDEPTGYALNIFRVKPEKRLFTFPEIGGYLQFDAAVERDHAYWHQSSQFVAITDQGSRHSRELYVVHIDGDRITVLPQPDFHQNALGRVGAVEIDFADVVTPQKWDGDDLVLKVYFTANHRRSYTFEVKLHIDHSPMNKPQLRLKSVEKLKEEEG